MPLPLALVQLVFGFLTLREFWDRARLVCLCWSKARAAWVALDGYNLASTKILATRSLSGFARSLTLSYLARDGFETAFDHTLSIYNGSCLSEHGFSHLAKLMSLQELRVRSTTVSDAAVIHLVSLQDLRHFQLGSNKMTDAGLQHIARLHALESLWLCGCLVSQEGLRPLARLLNLTDIRFSGCGVRYEAFWSRLGFSPLCCFQVFP